MQTFLVELNMKNAKCNRCDAFMVNDNDDRMIDIRKEISKILWGRIISYHTKLTLRWH